MAVMLNLDADSPNASTVPYMQCHDAHEDPYGLCKSMRRELALAGEGRKGREEKEGKERKGREEGKGRKERTGRKGREGREGEGEIGMDGKGG